MTTVQLPESVVEGKRLGRHVHHDPRSLRYPFRAPGVKLTSHRWSDDSTPILDQGNVGSCTGNATVGALLCNPENSGLSAAQKAGLNEDLAVKIYTLATQLDSIPGTYPQQDTGSDGLDAAKAAKQLGYIKGYSHAFTLQDALAALTLGPVLIGVPWTTGMDNPDATGLIKPSGQIRGGHELCLDEIDVDNVCVWVRNSWGASWGLNGRARMTFTSLGVLLSNRGDATVLAPLSAPAPAPTPVPKDEDAALADAMHTWLAAKGL